MHAPVTLSRSRARLHVARRRLIVIHRTPRRRLVRVSRVVASSRRLARVPRVPDRGDDDADESILERDDRWSFA